ncbi:hypothetical protein GCM10010448_44160 [Streptomyces glomeratus]|uniref:Uncharacterized protein n=1 Tax=Streptomyces glomeratus TaxID=284452 RepID=A0ABP6LQG2_9ACTN
MRADAGLPTGPAADPTRPSKEPPELSRINGQVRLAARPVGEPRPTDLQHVEEAIQMRLFRGDNHSKLVLKIADRPA